MTHARSDTAAPTLLPFGAFRSYSDLYRDYCAAFDRVGSYFRHDWRSADARADAVSAAASRIPDRGRLVRVLREQQALWGADASAERELERLSDPDSAVVVTGQQVGLFTGPMYTVLKALSTILLARQLEAETGRAVVPVFWLGSEDHDFAEMAGVGVPDGNELVDVRYAGHVLPETGNLGPVGALPLDASVVGLVDRMDDLLPESDFHGDIIEAIRGAYAPGTTFRDAFGRLLRWMLPDQGLVLMAADHPEFKKMALPLWKRDVEDGDELVGGIRETSGRLENEYHAQVHVSPTNLFVLHQGSRLPVDRDGERYRVRGTDQTWDRDELIRLLDTSTERFSPNVVLRPLTQDWILPTAAYVAGPGEVAYFAQYRSAYEWAGLPMPVIHPRASVALVERRIRRSLECLGRDIPEYDGDVEALFSELVLEHSDTDIDDRFATATSLVHQAVGAVKDPVTEVDASLGKTVEATRAALVKELERLRERVVRSERRRQDELRGQLDKVVGALFPDGGLQERKVSPLWFMSKYGPDLFVRLAGELDVMAGQLQIVDL